MSPFARARTRSGKDDNHDEMGAEARRWGASALDLHQLSGPHQLEAGIPDWLIAFRGRVMFWQVKNLATAYGRAGLTGEQKKFAARWPTIPTYEIATIEDARRALGVA